MRKFAGIEAGLAKTLAALGLDHFLASRPYLHDYERRPSEMEADEEAAEMEDDEPSPHPDEDWSDMSEAAPEADESLQIVADSARRRG